MIGIFRIYVLLMTLMLMLNSIRCENSTDLLPTQLQNLDENDRGDKDSVGCIDVLRHSLTPSGFDLQKLMISNSGKGINQLGNPDMCNDLPMTEYALFNIAVETFNSKFGV